MFDFSIHGEIYDGLSLDLQAVLDPKAGQSVRVLINSPGGSASEGAAIRAQFRRHGQVFVLVEGIVASAASLAITGAKRVAIADDAVFMLHDPSCGSHGTREDHRKTAEILDTMANVYAGGYAARSGKPLDEILEMMRVETWLSPDQALAMGFVDEIEGASSGPVATFDPAQFKNVPPRLVVALQKNGRADGSPDTQSEKENMIVKVRKAFSPQMVHKLMASKPLRGWDSSKFQMFAPVMPYMDAGASDEENANTLTLIEEVMATYRMAGSEEEFFQKMTEILKQAEIDGELDGDEPMQGPLKAAIAAACHVAAKIHAAQPPRFRGHPPSGRQDEGTTMRMGMEGALVARMTGARDVHGPARQYMGMTFAEMCAAHVGHRGSLRTAGDRVRVVEMALGSHSTSDFPAIFENSMNKALLSAYQAAPPSYTRIAARMDFRDFRPHSVAGVGDFPMLYPVGETGEIRYGTISESREVRALVPYGVAFAISRQMIVNDDLGSIERILSDRGRAVAAFEDKTFYAMALGGANSDGPTLLQTSRQVFNTTDGTKAGTAATLTVASLAAAWAAIRKRKSLDGNDLELQPAILLVGPDLEFAAMQLLAEINATKSSDVNPYAGKLEIVVTSKITGNAWYVFADPAAAPCFAYGYLEGEEGPRMRMNEPFGQQGMSWSIELDFGVGAIDWRGGYKNAGA